VDKSNFLAAQTYHRHQMPGPDFHVWDQFRGPMASRSIRNAPMLLGPLFAANASGFGPEQVSIRIILIGTLVGTDPLAFAAKRGPAASALRIDRLAIGPAD